MTFSSFKLIKVSDFPSGGDPQSIAVESWQAKYPVSDICIPGRVYVFERTGPINNGVFAKLTLATTLDLAGAHVTKSAGNLSYPFLGPPLYRVRFSKDGFQGEAFNVAAPDQEPIREFLIIAYQGKGST